MTGKYQQGRPRGSRLQRWNYFTRYSNPQAQAATAKYVALSSQYGLTPAQMALSFIQQQPFVTSAIIGATTIEQLQENLESANSELPRQLLREIDAVHEAQPNPAP